MRRIILHRSTPVGRHLPNRPNRTNGRPVSDGRSPPRRSAARGEVGRQHVVALRAVEQVGEALGQRRAGRRWPARPRRGTWPGGPWPGTPSARPGRAGGPGPRRCPTAVCGSTSMPVRACRSRMTSSVASSSTLAASKRGILGDLDRCRRRGSGPSSSAVRPPSRPRSSNSRRSWFDDTWMSIDGLSVGTTSSATSDAGLGPPGEDVVAGSSRSRAGRSARPSARRSSRRRCCRSCRWAP